jgi:hypothetical protein
MFSQQKSMGDFGNSASSDEPTGYLNIAAQHGKPAISIPLYVGLNEIGKDKLLGHDYVSTKHLNIGKSEKSVLYHHPVV